MTDDASLPVRTELDPESFAVAVGSGGVLAVAVGFALHSPKLSILGAAWAVTGGVLYGRARLAKRNEKIKAAESQIRSELDDLDPVARAQVLAGLARPHRGRS